MNSNPTTGKPLSAHARALVAALDDDEHCAALVIPTARLAAEEGMSYRQWDEWRRGELLSVGTAVKVLRADGWVLEVTHRAAPTPDCDRIIIVEQRHRGRAA